jgi:hypothetical protein
MPDEKPEAEQAFDEFRKAIVDMFADLRVQIVALETAVLKGQPLTQPKWRKLRDGVREAQHRRFQELYMEQIPSPYDKR